MQKENAKHMKLNEKQKQILLKYKLIQEDGSLTQTELIKPDNNPLGNGPVCEEAAILKLLAADPTPDQTWLDWVLFQAGGGRRARENSSRAVEQLKERYIAESVKGFTDQDTNEVFPPVSAEVAEKRWAEREEPEMKEGLYNGDQDLVEQLGTFGFCRAWPGPDGLYDKVVKVLHEFMQQKAKRDEMNLELAAQGQPQMTENPDDYDDLEKMEAANTQVTRYHNSKAVRNDIRAVQIYEDDNIRVICPLTWGASVAYGHESWPISSRETFDDVLLKNSTHRNVWSKQDNKGVNVFFQFKVATPVWIARKNQDFKRYSLENLLTEYTPNAFVINKLITEAGEAKTLNDVLAMLGQEPTRVDDDAAEEIPIKRGANVYKTQDEAAAVKQSLLAAVEATNAWIKGFDRNKIVRELNLPEK